MTEIREGDIYRWNWADPAKDADRGDYRSYHCCSMLAVVRNGRLHDTFWYGSDNRLLDSKDVTLTLLGNVNDLEEITKWESPYYRPDDIVDMRHSNNPHGPIYVRKGALRDAETMLERINDGLERSRNEIENARLRIDRLTKDAEAVRAGRLDEVVL